jgi:hypothetical protein
MKKRNHVKIANKGYGRKWQNFKIHYTGTRPKLIRDDGVFTSGKSILETLAARFKKFELILCDSKSKILKRGKVFQIFLSLNDLRPMNSSLISQKKDVTQRAIAATFSTLFPKYFEEGARLFNYSDGLFAGILTDHFAPTRLAKQDRTALANFIPKFIASGITKGASPSKFKAGFELKVLQTFAKDLEKRIQHDKSESTWQDYLKQNILVIQQGYIELVPKANIGVVGTSYPDFLLVTYDGYLDILEIKTPFTQLLLEDKSHKNYYWSGEVSRAIAQVENYIQAIEEIGDRVRNKVKDIYGIDLRVIRPRGIIFAGNSNQFDGNKLIQDDFRLLNQGLKNVTVVTYDELLTRLQNYMAALSGIRAKKK